MAVYVTVVNGVKKLQRVANSTVEYSAFNRLVPGSNPGRPI